MAIEALWLTGLSCIEWMKDGDGRYVWPDALYFYCIRLSEPIERPSAETVKVMYFPTDAGRCNLLFFALVFVTFLVRLGGYTGLVGWILFPTELLDHSQFMRIVHSLSAAERVRLRERHALSNAMKLPFRLGYTGHPGGPQTPAREASVTEREATDLVVCLPSEESSSDCLTLLLGNYKCFSLSHDSGFGSEVAARHGLPIVCIPARGTSELRNTRSLLASVLESG